MVIDCMRILGLWMYGLLSVNRLDLSPFDFRGIMISEDVPSVSTYRSSGIRVVLDASQSAFCAASDVV